MRAMTTLVVSDLHVGARTGADLLRRPEIRAHLIEALDGIDRLVLLGDAVELRHGPVLSVLETARPLFEELGAAMAGGEIVLAPGNHDHELLAAWFERRRFEGAGTLGLEERIDPGEGRATEQLAAWLQPASFSLAYPGVWLRDDVYAMHGHYVDCHLTVPTFERLSASLMERLAGDPAQDGHTPDAYEAPLAPIYAWLHAMAQHRRGAGAAAGGAELSSGVWKRLNGDTPTTAARIRWTAFGAMVPVGVAVANRAGLGPFRSELSGRELRRAGLAAMGEVVTRLGVDAPHVIFGHTHRPGPFPDDDLAEWTAPTGARLTNSGSWVYQPHFLGETPAVSPYWPGTAVRLEDDGPPEVVRLLQSLGHAELWPVTLP
jgi:hypothetical protein